MSTFCHKCGKQLVVGAKFCEACGTRVPQLPGAAMTTWQRRILIAVAVVITVMLLFPPYYFPRDGSTAVRHGYQWLLEDGWGRVEVELLLVQFLVVGVVGFIAYILCANKGR